MYSPFLPNPDPTRPLDPGSEINFLIGAPTGDQV